MKVKIEYIPEPPRVTKESDGGVVGYSYVIGGAELKDAGEVYTYPPETRWVEEEEITSRGEEGDWEGWKFSISQDESDALIQDIWVNQPEMRSLEGDKMTDSEAQYIIWRSEIPEAKEIGPILFSGRTYSEVWDFTDEGKVLRIAPRSDENAPRTR